MYLDFYGLAEKPFSTTPDPRFLFLSEGHRDALAQLVYGVRERKGFLALTGEVGTGKTTLLQALLRKLDANTATAFVFNSTLPFDGILEYALEDWGVSKPGQSHAQRLVALNNLLIERRRVNQNTVLILDEAQNLEPRTLEEVRLLSNFETPTDKLLQILLVGQPELADKLALPQLRQLKQRIALRCRIGALTPQETVQYVRSRLRVARAPDLGLFTERALTRIAAHSRGIPRIINIVCDHALLIGYTERKRRIDHDVAIQAIRYLQEGDRPRARGLVRARGWTGHLMGRVGTSPSRWVTALLVGAAVLGLGAIALPALLPGPGPVHDLVAPLTVVAERIRSAFAR